MLNLNYEGTAVWALSIDHIPNHIYELRIINQQTGKHISPFITSRERESRTQNIAVAHATDKIISRWGEQDINIIKRLGFIRKDDLLWLYLQPARYIYKIGDETGFITIFSDNKSKVYDNQEQSKIYNG